MPRLSIWNSGKKSFDYKFIDRTISEYFGIGGTGIFAHKYLGPYSQVLTGNDPSTDTVFTPPNPINPDAPVSISERSVQDVLLQENRDRQYDPNVYELRGIYNVGELDFNLSQFGLFLNNDSLYIEFHLNDLVASMGRRLIPGDVLELRHQRDDTIPDGLPAINKFYEVKEAVRASDGYSITWFPHIWRVKVEPMQAAQEFEDILQSQATDPLGFQTGQTLNDILSNFAVTEGINEAVVANAMAQVPKRFFETRQYFMVPGTEGVNITNPWLFTGGGDGIPPNGAIPIGSGSSFPDGANDGDYFLNTAYSPSCLFQYQASSMRWCAQEVDWRGTEWSACSRLLQTFINNDNTVEFADGTVANEKVNLSQAVKPRATFIAWEAGAEDVGDAEDDGMASQLTTIAVDENGDAEDTEDSQ